MAHTRLEPVLTWLEDHQEALLARLGEYMAYPAIAWEEDRFPDVERLARRLRDDLEKLGLQRARILRREGYQPLVAAESLAAGPDVPTVLLYGHYDIQPASEPEWRTPPHRATRQGERLYGRGAADDMGGFMVHLAAIQAWLAVEGELPCNVKLVLEGEEEVGSPGLGAYLERWPDAFEADAIVVTDAENPGPDRPGITTTLRGLMEMQVEVEALGADVHSGMWGNLAPDPAVILAMLIARLVDEDGRLRVGRAALDAARREALAMADLDAEHIRRGTHLRPGIDPLPRRDRTWAEWVWHQPTLTVLSTTLPQRENEKNAIRGRASARLSLRVAPGQAHEDLFEAVRDELLRDPPGGVRVHVSLGEKQGPSWQADLTGERSRAFYGAVDRAFRTGWDRTPQRVGMGATVPFVPILVDRFPGTPLLLDGVMDPETTAHGPNESMHLRIFRGMCRTHAALLAEVAHLGDPNR